VNLPRWSDIQKTLPVWPLTNEGHWNQGPLVRRSLELGTSDPRFKVLGSELAYWAWQQRPWDRRFLAFLHGCDHPALPTDQLRLAEGRAEIPRAAELLSQAKLLMDLEAAFDIFSQCGSDHRSSLFWLGELFELSMKLGEKEKAFELLERFEWTEDLLPFRQRWKAEWAFHCLSPGAALQEVESVDGAIWPWWKAYHTGELLIRAGDAETGRGILGRLATRIPWHVHVILKVYDLQFPLTTPVEITGEISTAILLYSWNKGDLLRETLGDLARSRLGRARIVVLDNGSTDSTRAVVNEAQRIFGNRLTRVELPVNIGAPAARNWLLSLPEVSRCEWVAFLDDDVRIPTSWLEELLAAGRAHPECGAVGCRVGGNGSPFVLQEADTHLFPPGEVEHFNILNSCTGELDTGLFTYRRPCVSVTGCCHLLRTKALERAGNFDIRFNPSQLDDFERDVRSFLAGFPCVYQGQTAVRHVQFSSLARARQARNRAGQGHVKGNKVKLEYMYSMAQVRQLVAGNQELIWEDLKNKADRLECVPFR
jgi:GT2 family glycosyltransferase